MKSLKAYEKIRDMILSGRRLPGTRLIIADLAEEMVLGKGPIREALMRLERSGLVRNIPYKGAVVAKPPKKHEVLYIYKLRKELESKLAVAALDHLTDRDIADLESLHQTMLGMPDNYYQFDLTFHHHIYRLANLPHLHAIATSLIYSVESVLNVYKRTPDQMVRFNGEHADILCAIQSKDPATVEKTMTDNIESGLSIIKETYAGLPSDRISFSD